MLLIFAPCQSLVLMCPLQAKSTKNVETDIVGDKIGRIHLGRQDLGELQTRKMKGLKRSRSLERVINEESSDEISEDEEVNGGVKLKRPKMA